MVMSPDENEELKKKRIDGFGSLLDFYSDRAEAHASFLVACVFGLFALVTIVQHMDVLSATILAVPYVMVVLVGSHCLKKFGFYADMSEAYRRLLEKYVSSEKEKIKMGIDGKEKEVSLKEYRRLSRKKYKGWDRFKKPLYIKLVQVVVFGLPFAIVYLPKLLQFIYDVIYQM